MREEGVTHPRVGIYPSGEGWEFYTCPRLGSTIQLRSIVSRSQVSFAHSTLTPDVTSVLSVIPMAVHGAVGLAASLSQYAGGWPPVSLAGLASFAEVRLSSAPCRSHQHDAGPSSLASAACPTPSGGGRSDTTCHVSLTERTAAGVSAGRAVMGRTGHALSGQSI